MAAAGLDGLLEPVFLEVLAEAATFEALVLDAAPFETGAFFPGSAGVFAEVFVDVALAVVVGSSPANAIRAAERDRTQAKVVLTPKLHSTSRLGLRGG